MDIVYRCSDCGRELYAVQAYGADLFLGTREECNRFLTIHERKTRQERAEDRSPRRLAKRTVRTFRVACRAGV